MDEWITFREAWDLTQTYLQFTTTRQAFHKLLKKKDKKFNSNMLKKADDGYHLMVNKSLLLDWIDWRLHWASVSELCTKKEFRYERAVTMVRMSSLKTKSKPYPLSIRKEDEHEFERLYKECIDG
jgi:hypothetical protein